MAKLEVDATDTVSTNVILRNAAGDEVTFRIEFNASKLNPGVMQRAFRAASKKSTVVGGAIKVSVLAQRKIGPANA